MVHFIRGHGSFYMRNGMWAVSRQIRNKSQRRQHQFPPSLHVHTAPHFNRWSLISLSLNLGQALMLVLVNRIQWKWSSMTSKDGFKKPWSFFLRTLFLAYSLSSESQVEYGGEPRYDLWEKIQPSQVLRGLQSQLNERPSRRNHPAQSTQYCEDNNKLI
jgi:hypothetical protein